MMAQVPLIVSDFPDMAQLLNKYNAGWAIPVTEEDLISLIKQIDARSLLEKRKNIRIMKEDHSWEFEEHRLIKAFDLLNKI